MIQAQVMAARLACARMTARHLGTLQDSVERACGLAGGSEWDRKAAAHAEWSAPASLEASMSANCLLVYRIPVPDNRFPHTFSAAYHRYMNGSGPRYTTAPSPSSRASRHRLPASPSSGR